MDKCLLIISCGEILGIGYEVVLKLNKFLKNNKFFLPVLVGNLTWLKYISKKLRLDLDPIVIDDKLLINLQEFRLPENKYLLIDISSNYDIFELKRKTGRISLDILEKTVDLIRYLLKSGEKFCLLTMPVSKKYIQKYDKRFIGHTEFFAKKFSIPFHNVSMLMEGEDKNKNLYRVLMLTRHVPLKDVVKNLDVEKNVFQIKNVVDFVDKHEKIKVDNILFCGLNPHNGDNGIIGKEEKTILLKTVERIKTVLYNKKIIYPCLVADAFNFVRNKKNSLIVCTYHDQAMIPLKLLCKYKVLNITVGLPFFRVSPGHGTAEDIMLKNKADISATKFCLEKLQEFLTNAETKS